MRKIIIFTLLFTTLMVSCESRKEKDVRIKREQQARVELEEKRKQVEEARAFKIEQDRIEQEIKTEEERVQRAIRLKKERKEKAIYDKYINNSLHTGATPYAYCFGKNYSCSEYGCSVIKVKTPYNSDVLVTIKKNGKVYRYAYINAGSTYTFEFENGTYQTFFYYGKGWNPNKFMKKTDCGPLKGGFIEGEVFGKDSPQILNNSILTYELILQQSGNFSTKPSNLEEAF